MLYSKTDSENFLLFKETKMMKTSRLIMIVIPLFAASMALLTGCKYDVAEPPYDASEFKEPQSKSTISSINPSDVAPGVNYVTINGVNLDLVPDDRIYLEIPGPKVSSPDIIEKNSTIIKIRRPDLVTDMCIVKLVPDSGSVVRSGSFKIDPVIEPHGSFLENLELRTVSVDNDENVYITEASSFIIWKITPDGEKTIVDTASRAPFGAVIGPGGYLYLLGSNRIIDRVNLSTGDVSNWNRLSSNRQVRVGDFDNDGYMYTGGIRTDLWIVAPDSSSSAAGFYSQDSIIAVKTYNGFVYVAVTGPNGRFIYRHSTTNGTLGAQELFLNWQASQFGSLLFASMAFASDGRMFIGTDAADALVVFDPATNQMDYFYKGILPPYCKGIQWGTGNYLYMIGGNTEPAQDWKAYKVDMGSTGG